MSEAETQKVGDSINVSVVFSTVRLEIECKSEYEAQVLYEDVVERLTNGGQLGITPGKPQRG